MEDQETNQSLIPTNNFEDSAIMSNFEESRYDDGKVKMDFTTPYC